MILLQKLVQITEGIEGLSGVHEGIKKFVVAEGAAETSAAAGQLAAELAITAAVTATVRASMSLLRLGLAVSGQSWKWEALSWAVGAGSGLSAGALLDLDGDGIETVGLSANIYFDHDADGVLTKTGWVGKDDALLVWDRNANGRIDTGAELFGDFTALPNGALAPNGFAALAALDANSDGMLDARDPAFAELRLWCDACQVDRAPAMN